MFCLREKREKMNRARNSAISSAIKKIGLTANCGKNRKLADNLTANCYGKNRPKLKSIEALLVFAIDLLS